MNNYSVGEIAKKVLETANTLEKEYKLGLHSIEFIKTDAIYGKCSFDGMIQLKIEYWDGELVPEMEVWRSLAHEMAHLKHFNHGDEFWKFNKVLAIRIGELVGKKIRPEIAFTNKGNVVY